MLCNSEESADEAPVSKQELPDFKVEPALQLLVELSVLKISQLQRRAAAAGVDEAEIDAAVDSDGPKDRLIRLLLPHSTGEIPPIQPHATYRIAPALPRVSNTEDDEDEDEEQPGVSSEEEDLEPTPPPEPCNVTGIWHAVGLACDGHATGSGGGGELREVSERLVRASCAIAVDIPAAVCSTPCAVCSCWSRRRTAQWPEGRYLGRRGDFRCGSFMFRGEHCPVTLIEIAHRCTGKS